MNKEQQLNKLLKEYDYKIIQLQTSARVLLIDFAREYNQIWREE